MLDSVFSWNENPHSYMNAVSDAYSIKMAEQDQEAASMGATVLSIETGENEGEASVHDWIGDHITEFLTAVRKLDDEDQELLLSYYIAGETQTRLGRFWFTTQTLMSSWVRAAVQRLGAVLLLGDLTPEVMAPILTAAGIEHLIDQPLSKIIAMYAKVRSFQRVGEVLGLRPQNVRTAMRAARDKLLVSDDLKQRALGAFLFGLLENASTEGTGVNKTKRAKQGDVYQKDGDILGQFVIDLGVDRDAFDKHCFTSRANWD
jgi:hypothetical protein